MLFGSVEIAVHTPLAIASVAFYEFIDIVDGFSGKIWAQSDFDVSVFGHMRNAWSRSAAGFIKDGSFIFCLSSFSCILVIIKYFHGFLSCVLDEVFY